MFQLINSDESFVKSLLKSPGTDNKSEIPNMVQVVYFGSKDNCIELKICDTGNISVTFCEELKCNHLEADTRLVLHALHAMKAEFNEVMLFILIHNY